MHWDTSDHRGNGEGVVEIQAIPAFHMPCEDSIYSLAVKHSAAKQEDLGRLLTHDFFGEI